ncbi:galactose-3-O-sulfotransferase 2-like [Narcine bancroftii]|uniref:galactose-3-O-sulfotransferase 2-like n=1 Tax=Narcine bancroftii TaxID=1343680 RepID=UPI003831714F
MRVGSTPSPSHPCVGIHPLKVRSSARSDSGPHLPLPNLNLVLCQGFGDSLKERDSLRPRRRILIYRAFRPSAGQNWAGARLLGGERLGARSLSLSLTPPGDSPDSSVFSQEKMTGSQELYKLSRMPARYVAVAFAMVTSLSFCSRMVYLSTRNRFGITPEPICQPRTHVVFLKTHKTASSTVLNILYRFGDSRNLTFALPFLDHLGYPSLFQAWFVKGFNPTHSKEYNIICNHMRFNLPEVEKVMPKDSFYFTILRNPNDLFESSFSYFQNDARVFRRAPSLEEFAQNPHKYYRPNEMNSQLARNVMWFDLGGNHNGAGELERVNRTLQELDANFDLVLLSEYFDQSLILLREALCWSLEDIAYFQLNVRGKSDIPSLSPYIAFKLRQWNSLDWLLYNHFNASFWLRVAAYGETRMDHDVSRLREMRRRLGSTCLLGDGPAANNKVIPPEIRPPSFGKAKILGYALKPNLMGPTKEMCTRMILPEKHYLHRLMVKQELIKTRHRMAEPMVKEQHD